MPSMGAAHGVGLNSLKNFLHLWTKVHHVVFGIFGRLGSFQCHFPISSATKQSGDVATEQTTGQ